MQPLKGAVLALLATTLITLPGRAQTPPPSPLLAVLQEELQHSLNSIKARGSVPAWYLSYAVTDDDSQQVEADDGAICTSAVGRRRVLDIDLKLGDKPHEGRGNPHHSFGRQLELPTDDDPYAIRRALWLATDTQYRNAARELRAAEASSAIEPEARKISHYSIEAPQRFVSPPAPEAPAVTSVEQRMRDISSVFRSFPELTKSRVIWKADRITRYFVTSEGTSLQVSNLRTATQVAATARADDGMELLQYGNVENVPNGELPPAATGQAVARKVADDLMHLRKAPVMDAYAGPAIFSGRAAAVLFHENLGHRVEGRRQDDETQGHTFIHQLNRRILPTFISVYDDPTLQRIGDIDLNGHYLYDEEGVLGQRVDIVDHGVLKNYLLSRTMVTGFTHSNGHGRAAAGFPMASRQGNLIVESSKTVSKAELRKLLLAECKRQGKPFGLYFDQVSGGSTFVGAEQPQIFQVHPLLVYRIYVDGRPDQMVRGVEIVGTPLASFLNIKACSDTREVFNGVCGAESGPVPVAGIAPSILTSQIETQKESWTPHRPPLLPPPNAGGRDVQ